MAQLAQPPAQMADVLGDPARMRVVVRGDQAYLHDAFTRSATRLSA